MLNKIKNVFKPIDVMSLLELSSPMPFMSFMLSYTLYAAAGVSCIISFAVLQMPPEVLRLTIVFVGLATLIRAFIPRGNNDD